MNPRRNKHKRRLRLWTIPIFFILTCALLAGGVVFYAYQMEAPPLQVAQTTTLYAQDASPIGEFEHSEQRYWIPIDEMGTAIQEATLAVEDRRFYSHPGLDPVRITRAIITNLQTGRKSEGASTITQQYARNLYLYHDKTWERKLHEAFYALRLELHYSKEEILEGYLNTIYYGHGVYGIQAAADAYFSKPAQELTYAEAAMLAGIPKGPSVYSPFIDEEAARERQRIVLASLTAAGFTSPEEERTYVNESLSFTQKDRAKTFAPHFKDAVRAELMRAGIDEEVINRGGLKIYTTLDVEMQEHAEALVQEQLTEANVEVALTAQDPRTGAVVAMIGGKDYDESAFNRAVQARRHSGSTMKPFLYYAALEHGLHPNSMLKSEETTFVYDEGREEYKPSNFNHQYANDYITMLQALALSDNIYAMKTHFLLGFDRLGETAREFGITSELRATPSLALGTAEVGVLEMGNAYAPFANGGSRVAPQLVTQVDAADGTTILEVSPRKEEVLNPAYTAMMTNMMQGMFEPSLNASYASVTGASISEALDRPVAGKSGSTLADSWMIGFTPQLLTTVWTGYDDGSSLERGDSQYAKKLWAEFMKRSLDAELKLAFHVPENVHEVDINPANGLLASDSCPVSRTTLFYNGTEPTDLCTSHLADASGAVEEAGESLPHQHEGGRERSWLGRLTEWTQDED
ncbi:PBP1A family penicillin-binding protein [Paenalkalicoccus suaedae]|uniref:PBP1A family penicillin-binding protein n=1 Tax=Paenalkalicoccus suaedae TaxID=2592382 RepID=A0A859FHI9_9BACI|nr:PBP1A family penicillin-binding protein [Paenalkalicoccus suaedae]QKS72813.1 PBP1A family penicillin-binding protein [Paenalkalicoccus suaedae]